MTDFDFEWSEFDPGFDRGTVAARKPNVPGIFGECEVDLGSADVRKCNCKGQVGDEQFCQLLTETQAPMTSGQLAWRAAVLVLALLPLVGLMPVVAYAMDETLSIYVRLALVAVALAFALGPFMGLYKCILTVKGGELVFAQLAEDGRTLVLQPGLHLLPNLGSQKQRFQVTSDEMRFGTMALIRVRPGFIGIGTDNGTPMLLLPGLHLYRAPNLQYQGVKSVNEDMISNGPLNIVRVQPGMIGLTKVNGEPVILESGVHFINEASFVMDARSGFRKVDERQLQLGQLQIIVVPKGMIAAVLVNGEGHFLLEGRHFVSHSRFSLLSMKNLSDEYICAGVRHRILVPAGKLGLGLEAGEPQLLEPGKVVLRNSSLFQYSRSVDITQPVITHGSLSIVTVRDGQFGISYRDGVIELLKPGRHHLTSATHVPGGFIGAGQQTLRISEVTGMSSDNVELRFDAAICMRVVDPQKAVVMLTQGQRDLMDELKENIQERAKLALSIIIGNNSLNRKHGATMQMAAPEDALDAEGEGADESGEAKTGGDEDSFRQFIHDIFMRSFSASMLKECGVQVIDMSIEDVVIVNSELATAMASAAVANSNLEKATIEAEIVQVTANADAKVALIDAQGKAKAMQVLAKADAERISTISGALQTACTPAQQLEQVKASAAALSQAGSTVMLAQDTGALATLLGGAQGAKLGPSLA